MRICSPRTGRAGLSLIEVIVSLAIFLMSLVALGQLISLGGDAARNVQWISRSMMIAESKMAELASGSLPLTSLSETPCEEDTDFSWSVTSEAESAPGLFRVTVIVSRPRPDGSRFETTLNQMILDPTIRGNTNGTATGADATTTGTTTGTTSGTTGGTTSGGGP